MSFFFSFAVLAHFLILHGVCETNYAQLDFGEACIILSKKGSGAFINPEGLKVNLPNGFINLF